MEELNDLLLRAFDSSSFRVSMFNMEPRAYGKAGEEIVIKRFSTVAPMKNKARSGVEDLIAFRVSQPVKLQTVGIFGNASRFAKYNVIMKVIRVIADQQEIIASRDTMCTAENTNCIFRVAFEELVPIEPENFYIVSVILDGEQAWYGCGGKPSVDSSGADNILTVDFFEAGLAPSSAHRARHAHYGTRHLTQRRRHTSGNITNVSEGQIPELIFRSIALTRKMMVI
ncbi:BTB/POZ domain-containing protein 3-like [Paramacrobiotus metropolitanus]|uniref:BTB/POZ domain-containing protein 3-like n=1 Tax=Paramacrobiotus metropolitanus TaxID=2943436 RepID=UPI002446103E|nr:BTB/POZ domain-containing protein 3-like [Paramacrobiotus metropolitanus]